MCVKGGFFMNRKQFTLPFSHSYWHCSISELKDTKKLCLCALMMALQILLSNPLFKIPLAENLSITFGYLAVALNSAVVGPVLSLLFGFVLDNISFMLFPSGVYFFGYTLSCMAGALVYALFLYRTKISLLRLFLAKLTVNLFVNVLLGSLWSAMLYSKGYLYYLSISAIKNLTILPLEVFLLYLLFKAFIPFLYRKKWVVLSKISLF